MRLCRAFTHVVVRLRHEIRPLPVQDPCWSWMGSSVKVSLVDCEALVIMSHFRLGISVTRGDQAYRLKAFGSCTRFLVGWSLSLSLYLNGILLRCLDPSLGVLTTRRGYRRSKR